MTSPVQNAQVTRASGRVAETEAAVAVRDAVKVYGKGDAAVRALDGVSLPVAPGEFLAVMGPSGSGKSTLLHCMAGLDSLTSGTVWIGGRDVTALGDAQLTRLRRSAVGFMFQAFNLLPTLNAEQNILLPLELAGRPVEREWYRTLVDRLGIADRLRHRPSELSGGQQQRVAAARALVTRPTVVFADEPTGNLDSAQGAALLTFLAESVHELGQTIVMVTHDAFAASHADRAVLLGDGRIVCEVERPTQEGILDTLRQLGG